MKKLTLNQIENKIRSIKFPKFDLIVAIANDGIKPATILKTHLKIPVETIHINYRDENNKPIKKEPILTKPIKKELKTIKNKNILIVDTVSRTGKTLKKAKEILRENKTKTFVINGKADYSLFNFKECIEWPW